MGKRTFLLMICLGISIFLEAHPAWGIDIDSQGNIYFADIFHNNGSVWKLTSAGELKLLLQNFHAHNVNLDRHENLITAHGEVPYTLVRLNKTGDIDTLYQTTDYKEFFAGNCAWSSIDNKIIYGLRDHQYLRSIDNKGHQENIGDFAFTWNQSIYVADDGTIYAPDIGIDNGILVKINIDGTSTVIAKDLISKLDRPKDKHNDILLGIAEDAEGVIYIAELAGQRIISILENQNKETYYTSEGDWFPTAIDFYNGEAYILENNTKNGSAGIRITKISKAGNQSEIFNFASYKKGESSPLMPKIKDQESWWLLPLLILVVLVCALAMFKLKNITSLY